MNRIFNYYSISIKIEFGCDVSIAMSCLTNYTIMRMTYPIYNQCNSTEKETTNDRERERRSNRAMV